MNFDVFCPVHTLLLAKDIIDNQYYKPCLGHVSGVLNALSLKALVLLFRLKFYEFLITVLNLSFMFVLRLLRALADGLCLGRSHCIHSVYKLVNETIGRV